MTAFEDFVNTELPQRSVHLTFATTGHDADPNVGAPAILNGAPLGTWFREQTAAVWWRKTSILWEQQGGAASSSSGASYKSIYKQGGPGVGPGEYSDFLALYADLVAARTAAGGSITGDIVLDTELVAAVCTVPVLPPVDFGAPSAAFTVAVSTVTLTDATASFTALSIGQFVTIAAATTPSNNGVFRITAVPSTTTIEYENPGGVAEAQGGATYSITNPYVLTGIGFDGGPFAAVLSLDDGVTTVGMRKAKNFCDVRGNNTLHPVEVLPNEPLGVLMQCQSNSGFENAGTADMFDVATNSVGFLLMILTEGSRLGFNEAGPLFGGTNTGDGFQSGSFFFAQVFDANPVQPPLGGSHRPGMIKGATGSSMLIQTESTQVISTTAGSPGTAFPSWQGLILTPQLTEPSFLVPNPFQGPAATAPVAAALGQNLRLDVSGGAIAQPLPSISNNTFGLGFPGGMLSAVELGGAAGLTLTPAAGDTINGVAGPFSVPSGGSALLMSDGVSNWEVVAVFNNTSSFEVGGEDDASSFEAGGAFAQGFQFATNVPAAGDYLISWMFEVKNDTLNGITRTRVQLNDSAVEADLSFADVPIVSNVTCEQVLSGHKRVTLTAGAHTVDIDFFPFTGANAEIRRKRIEIRKVS